MCRRYCYSHVNDTNRSDIYQARENTKSNGKKSKEKKEKIRRQATRQAVKYIHTQVKLCAYSELTLIKNDFPVK